MCSRRDFRGALQGMWLGLANLSARAWRPNIQHHESAKIMAGHYKVMILMASASAL